MLLFFGCHGVEGSVRFPSPSLPPHSGITIPCLTNMSATQAMKLGNFTSKSCRGHKRNVSKFVMHLQTEKLFGFLNQSPFSDVLVAVAFADEKAHLSYSAMCMHVERKHSIQRHPTAEFQMVFSISRFSNRILFD